MQNIQGIELGAGIERLLENNNTLMAQMITNLSDLNAVVWTQNQHIESLETQLQQSRSNKMKREQPGTTAGAQAAEEGVFFIV